MNDLLEQNEAFRAVLEATTRMSTDLLYDLQQANHEIKEAKITLGAVLMAAGGSVEVPYDTLYGGDRYVLFRTVNPLARVIVFSAGVKK